MSDTVRADQREHGLELHLAASADRIDRPMVRFAASTTGRTKGAWVGVSFEDKVIAITGAGRGIGREHATGDATGQPINGDRDTGFVR